MRRGFSLIEMLVVIGILAILIGAGMSTFSSATRKAQLARAREVVSNVATALESALNKDGAFPRRILQEGSSDCEMDERIAYELAKRNLMSLTSSNKDKKTVGLDGCGVLTPWGQDAMKQNKNATEGTAVPSGGTIKDHRVHFAVDVDGDGYVEANVGGESVKIRAAAAAWCCGRGGKMYKYSEGVRHECSYSWTRDQVEK